MLMGIVYDFGQVFARGYSTRKAGAMVKPAPQWARDTMEWDDVAHRSLWVRCLEVVEQAAARVTPTARMMGAKKQPSG